LRPWEIAKLSDQQVAGLYYRPPGGEPPEPRDDGPARDMTPAEARAEFFIVGRAMGLSEFQIEREWLRQNVRRGTEPE
jgi:hypothetical protein